ncbi:hypothetical protein J6590_062862 [Homalodisca vitripennis]|nr:hypothetical protein J6590_062862 [Homalodisca vitripennis]
MWLPSDLCNNDYTEIHVLVHPKKSIEFHLNYNHTESWEITRRKSTLVSLSENSHEFYLNFINTGSPEITHKYHCSRAVS